MRIFWRTLAVIGSVVVLLLVAVAIAIHSVDVRQFVAPLQQRVKEATGRDLAIRGDISLKFGLEPKLVIDDVALSNASWAKQPQMISAKQIEAQIALLPLLRKRFEVVSFKLVSPAIDLETDPRGKGNWEFPGLGASPRAGATAPSGGTLGAFAVGDLSISDGALTYRDGRTGETTTVVIEELSVHARDAQSPLSGRFRGKINETPVALEGDFGPLDQLAGRRWPYPVTVQGNINEKKSAVSTKVSVQGNAITLDQLQMGYGTTQLTGQMSVTTGGPRPVIAFKLAAPTMTLGELAATAAANAKAAKAAAAKSHFVFSEESVDIAALRAVDATGDLAIDKLMLPDGQHVDQLHVQLSLQNGRLDIPVLQASAFGGSIQAHAQLDASKGNDAPLALHMDAKSLDLGAILAAHGVKREVRGGKTDVKVDLNSHGASQHQWAANASGSVLAVVGQASLANSKGGADVAVERLADAVNPFRNVDAATELQCAVVRLPLHNGIATVDRSIAIETNKLAASASGTLDFRTETLDLSIKPQVHQGVSINLNEVAQLVRFHGPFSNPAVGVDAAATAATVAKIGAAMSTGSVGLAALGASLIAPPSGDAGAPCQVALGHATAGAAATASATTAKQQPVPADDIGKAVGKLFGR
jgi:uncharacterized protein involved in outer membrane biogenesis